MFSHYGRNPATPAGVVQVPKASGTRRRNDSIFPRVAATMEKGVSPTQPDLALDGRPALRHPHRFTSTAVPRFYGTVCWHQHKQVSNATAESNGWDDRMAALQFFGHLEGKALNVALLLPEDQRNSPQGLSNVESF